MKIPKLRMGSYFPDDVIERYSRTDRAVVAAVAEMYATGVSTRKVERVAARLGVAKMSASQVSRICAGDFKRLDGNALRVCKYAQQVAARTQTGRGAGRVAGELEGKLTQLLVASPDAALAVGALIDALLATSPADTAAAGA